MSRFKPEIFYCRGTQRIFADEIYVTEAFSTYRDLRRHLKEHLLRSTGEVTVTRSLRGQWGEWVEKWELRRGKPVKVEEFWM